VARTASTLGIIAACAFAARYAAGQIPTSGNHQRAHLANLIDQWAIPVGITAACLAIATPLLAAILRHATGGGIGGGQTGKRATALAGTLAIPMRCHPSVLTVRKTTWRGGVLISGQVHYPPEIPMPIHPETALPERLRPLAAADLQVTHDPGRRTISFHPAPPEPAPTPWWDRESDEKASPTLSALHTALAGFLDELDIARDETHYTPDGAIAKITLTYSAATTKPTSERFRTRIKEVLDQMVPAPTGAWNYIWLPHRSRLVLTPGTPLPDHLPIPLPPDDLPRHSLPLGQRATGTPGLWQPSRFPHLLVAGATGGGKSVLIRTILLQAVLCGWDVYLADPKKLGYRGFARWLNLPQSRVATTGQTMEAMVLAVTVEMRRRYQLCEWGQARPTDFRPLLLILDENTEAIAAMNSHAKAAHAEETGKKPPKNHTSPAVEALWEIARLGREAGTYAVYAHQRPDVTYIPGEARDNLLSRIAAGQLRGDGAEMMFGTQAVEQRVTLPAVDENTGEIYQVPVPGRATVDLGNGPEPLQVSWTPKIWDEQDCPPDSADAASMAALQPAARAAWAHANPGLLPGTLQIRDGDGAILGPTGGTPAATLYNGDGQQSGHLVIDPGDHDTTDGEPVDGADTEHADAEPDTPVEFTKHTTNGTVLSLVTATPEPEIAPASQPPGSTEAPEAAPAGPNTTEPDDATAEEPPWPADEHDEDAPPEPDGSTADPDESLTRAARHVIRSQNASAVPLARQLCVRRDTATRLLYTLQEAGIVGEAASGHPRPVHVPPDGLDDALTQLAELDTEHTEEGETP
jgi:hypothetical protein